MTEQPWFKKQTEVDTGIEEETPLYEQCRWHLRIYLFLVSNFILFFALFTISNNQCSLVGCSYTINYPFNQSTNDSPTNQATKQITNWCVTFRAVFEAFWVSFTSRIRITDPPSTIRFFFVTTAQFVVIKAFFTALNNPKLNRWACLTEDASKLTDSFKSHVRQCTWQTLQMLTATVYEVYEDLCKASATLHRPCLHFVHKRHFGDTVNFEQRLHLAYNNCHNQSEVHIFYLTSGLVL
jgi:hypothetical protein